VKASEQGSQHASRGWKKVQTLIGLNRDYGGNARLLVTTDDMQSAYASGDKGANPYGGGAQERLDGVLLLLHTLRRWHPRAPLEPNFGAAFPRDTRARIASAHHALLLTVLALVGASDAVASFLQAVPGALDVLVSALAVHAGTASVEAAARSAALRIARAATISSAHAGHLDHAAQLQAAMVALVKTAGLGVHELPERWDDLVGQALRQKQTALRGGPLRSERLKLVGGDASALDRRPQTAPAPGYLRPRGASMRRTSGHGPLQSPVAARPAFEREPAQQSVAGQFFTTMRGCSPDIPQLREDPKQLWGISRPRSPPPQAGRGGVGPGLRSSARPRTAPAAAAGATVVRSACPLCRRPAGEPWPRRGPTPAAGGARRRWPGGSRPRPGCRMC